MNNSNSIVLNCVKLGMHGVANVEVYELFSVCKVKSSHAPFGIIRMTNLGQLQMRF